MELPGRGRPIAHVFAFGDLEFVVFECAVESMVDGLPLTDAEREVAEMIARGHTNAAVARARRVSIATVASQTASIYRKLHVHSRAELTALLSYGSSAPDSSCTPG